jgi:hypothetical protein
MKLRREVRLAAMLMLSSSLSKYTLARHVTSGSSTVSEVVKKLKRRPNVRLGMG